MESVITLYDIASNRGGKPCWNPFVLKTRLALELKKLPYKRVLLEYPEVEPTLRRLGAQPTGKKPDGTAYYTVPVIVDPINRASTGEVIIVSDSWDIAVYLDSAYPDRPLLFPNGTKVLQHYFHDQFWKEIFSYLAFIVFLPAHDLLNCGSQEYFRSTREALLGERFEDMCPKGTKKCEDLWSAVERMFTNVLELDRNDEHTFIMGNEPSYGDITLLAVLECIFVALSDDWEGRVRKWDKGHWEKLKSNWDAYLL